LFSLIVLTFNSRAYIKDCLDSILTQRCKDFEVIVVDNGSKDGTTAFIRTNYPGVILVKNKENLAQSIARNQGIEIARGEWLLAMDCDVRLEENFVGRLVEAAKHISSEVGMIQPKILYPDKLRIFSAGIFISPLKRFYDIGRGKSDSGRFNSPGYVFGACSAAALYRRRMLDDIKDVWGYFDERLFFLLEDADLSWRAQEAGWKAWFYPHLACYHYGNSSRTSKKLRQYLCWKNRYTILNKHKLSKLKLFIISICYDIPRAIFLFFTNPYYTDGLKK